VAVAAAALADLVERGHRHTLLLLAEAMFPVLQYKAILAVEVVALAEGAALDRRPIVAKESEFATQPSGRYPAK